MRGLAQRREIPTSGLAVLSIYLAFRKWRFIMNRERPCMQTGLEPIG